MTVNLTLNGKKIEYDGASGRVTNSAEANDLLKRAYREGWKLEV